MSPSPSSKQQNSSTQHFDQDTLEANSTKAWPYLLIYVTLPIIFVDHYRLSPVSPFLALIFVFVLIPLADYCLGRDDYNPPAAVRKLLEKRITFRNITLLWLPCYSAIIFWGAYVAYPQCDTLLSKCMLTLNSGILSGVSINMAHELIHKHEWVEHWAGRICYCLTMYGHFTVEHLQGHHVNVSTMDDPASSRKGESLYTFLPRSFIGSALSAWKLDYKTCNLLWGITLLFCLIMYPSGSLVYFILQGIIGATFLEIINYIEHYGLSRNPGEPVTPMHSWNAGDRLTNYLLLKLQRHSDHHANPGWRYQTLRSWPHSPQLPFGYATMVLIALVPPLWFKIMNPRVDQVKAHYLELQRQNKLDKVFTSEYLISHPEDMKLAHWNKPYTNPN